LTKGNPRYRAGRALEYLIKDKLEKQGYFVIRAAGSHGVADLVAFGAPSRFDGEIIHGDILFISCKLPMYAPPAERRKLLDMAERCGAQAMMTVKVDGKWELRKVES
jgi:Holliday junction resolvase